jgi:type IV pilus assembly protein PilB
VAKLDLGDLLVKEGLATADQLQKARQSQAAGGGPLTTVLLQEAKIGEETLHKFLSAHYGVEYVGLSRQEIPAECIKLMTAELAARYQAIPCRKSAKKVTVACADPGAPALLKLKEDMRLDPKVELAFAVTLESEVQTALDKYYKQEATLAVGKDGAGSGLEFLGLEAEAEQGPVEGEFGEDAASDAPVIRLVNSIISQAVAKRASDIHLNPFEKSMTLRYRIDGALQTQADTPPKYRRAMVARIKVMAELDIMEKRRPQDGRIKIKVQGKMIDLRVSTLPTIYGENVVMRILDQEKLQLDMTKLGFEPDEMDKYLDALSQPYGMILHTGPTGSGKTTTLYSALSRLNHPSKNLMTIEDPIEYQLAGVIQCQVNPDADLTFANVLRANLRQDPNVIMVGEIRDGETADIAIKAALTGHLVLSTLHTNDAPSTVMRLVDMGIDPIYVGSSVLIVVAQRLVRRICDNCKEVVQHPPEELERAQVDPKEIEGVQLYHGHGCSQCNGSGYRGRIALYEIMRVTPTIAEAVFRRADLNEMTELAKKEGMSTLRQLAVRKWKGGITSLEEVLRVTAGE